MASKIRFYVDEKILEELEQAEPVKVRRCGRGGKCGGRGRGRRGQSGRGGEGIRRRRGEPGAGAGHGQSRSGNRKKKARGGGNRDKRDKNTSSKSKNKEQNRGFTGTDFGRVEKTEPATKRPDRYLEAVEKIRKMIERKFKNKIVAGEIAKISRDEEYLSKLGVTDADKRYVMILKELEEIYGRNYYEKFKLMLAQLYNENDKLVVSALHMLKYLYGLRRYIGLNATKKFLDTSLSNLESFKRTVETYFVLQKIELILKKFSKQMKKYGEGKKSREILDDIDMMKKSEDVLDAALIEHGYDDDLFYAKIATNNLQIYRYIDIIGESKPRLPWRRAVLIVDKSGSTDIVVSEIAATSMALALLFRMAGIETDMFMFDAEPHGPIRGDLEVLPSLLIYNAGGGTDPIVAFQYSLKWKPLEPAYVILVSDGVWNIDELYTMWQMFNENYRHPKSRFGVLIVNSDDPWGFIPNINDKRFVYSKTVGVGLVEAVAKILSPYVKLGKKR